MQPQPQRVTSVPVSGYATGLSRPVIQGQTVQPIMHQVSPSSPMQMSSASPKPSSSLLSSASPKPSSTALSSASPMPSSSIVQAQSAAPLRPTTMTTMSARVLNSSSMNQPYSPNTSSMNQPYSPTSARTLLPTSTTRTPCVPTGVTPATYVTSPAPTLPQSSPVVRRAQPLQPTQTLVSSAAPLGAQPAQPVLRTTAPNLGPAYTQQSYEEKHKDDPQLQNLKELRKSSGLRMVPVKAGLQTMHKYGNEGKLTRDLFLMAYGEILATHGVEPPNENIRNAVFDLFDRDDNGVVDMMEIICGISLLCEGSEDDKIHAVFDIFDQNGDGFISMDEMYLFLTSVFKVVLTPNVMGVMNSMGVTVESAEDLASVTALECFKTADLNHDGKLSITEFKNWFYAPQNDPAFLFSPVRKLLN